MIIQQAKDHYFTEVTAVKFFCYLFVCIYVIICCCVFIAEPYVTTPECSIISTTKIMMPNPLYEVDLCRSYRYKQLLYLTREECSYGRRLVSSVVYGGIVGWERRQSDRPAGIRTMSLVSLGSCMFTITSAFNFLDGPMGWDASRIAAAIPSGVGFLGAGLIFKDTQTNKETGMTSNVVHGLTTAASLWISAAVGVACAGELYFCANFSVALVLTLLRFGPRQKVSQNDCEEHDEDPNMAGHQFPADETVVDNNVPQHDENYGTNSTTFNSVVGTLKEYPDLASSERSGLLKRHTVAKGPRPRATLAGDM